ncbi:hypothetical protein [Jatrophihabitans lederbergiae]|uniref:Uncharacterized protein n=1 Tax=Jatrophihabitans lederbergiae TaxID=3075547 RepID=A0ABU2JGJ5_9ACTN|nr:hypothetical protein [Jatrophihabitans sp. DSM 44399]MDT0264117.1 hypothetical protein [Jatrophihabitans sp. DSM 44399]
MRDALQGKAGRDALAALLTVVRRYVTEHPGRYAGSLAALLGGYGVCTADTDHAARTVRCLAGERWGPARSAAQPTANQRQADGGRNPRR